MSSGGAAAEATMWSTSMATWASVETAKAAAIGTTGVACMGAAGGVAIIMGAAMGAGGAPS